MLAAPDGCDAIIRGTMIEVLADANSSVYIEGLYNVFTMGVPISSNVYWSVNATSAV